MKFLDFHNNNTIASKDGKPKFINLKHVKIPFCTTFQSISSEVRDTEISKNFFNNDNFPLNFFLAYNFDLDNCNKANHLHIDIDL